MIMSNKPPAIFPVVKGLINKDNTGKNTGVGCHFLLQCMKVKSESEVAQSHPTLSDPTDCSLTRLLRPWDFPGKSTGVGCHCRLLKFQPQTCMGTGLGLHVFGRDFSFSKGQGIDRQVCILVKQNFSLLYHFSEAVAWRGSLPFQLSTS